MNMSLTADIAADIAGVTTATMRKWCREGKIYAAKKNGEWRINQDSLEGAIYTAYLNISKDSEDEITIVNKYGEMINDFPVLNTSVQALESYGWELVTRVWKNVSDEDNPYGKFKISVRRA